MTEGVWLGKQSEALVEGIEVLGHPGAKQTGQAHTGVTAFGTARAATDLASDDQRAHTALRRIVVGRNAWHRNEDKQFGQKALHRFTEGMLRGM